jgi:protein ImuB
MPRVVSLFLPTWSTDRVRRTLGSGAPLPDAPLVLVGREGRRRVVLARRRLARAPLPIAALRLPRDMVDELRRLGFECVSDLLTKPHAPLALRFGPELGRRLDQAVGRLNEPIDPVRLPDLIEMRRAFAEPIGAAETIARYTGKLVVQLCEALEAKGLGAKRVDLLLHRVDNRLEAIRIATALPVRDVKRLTRLLCDKIETVDPGFGIEIMSLTATLAEPLAPKQVISSLTDAPEADVSDLIDTRDFR